MSPTFELRPAIESDREFVYQVKRDGFRDQVEATFGAWNDSFQRVRFGETFSVEGTLIIEIDGRPAGFLELRPEAGGIRVKNIALLAAHRGSGIGTAVLEHVLSLADRVTLRVLKNNVRALQLYQRLGFCTVGESDENWWEMEWRAPGAGR